jgi:hypothetical protein
MVEQDEVQEALAALERLARHGVVPAEDALAAARLITGNPAYEFPPQRAPEPPAPG